MTSRKSTHAIHIQEPDGIRREYLAPRSPQKRCLPRAVTNRILLPARARTRVVCSVRTVERECLPNAIRGRTGRSRKSPPPLDPTRTCTLNSFRFPPFISAFLGFLPFPLRAEEREGNRAASCQTGLRPPRPDFPSSGINPFLLFLTSSPCLCLCCPLFCGHGPWTFPRTHEDDPRRPSPPPHGSRLPASAFASEKASDLGEAARNETRRGRDRERTDPNPRV